MEFIPLEGVLNVQRTNIDVLRSHDMNIHTYSCGRVMALGSARTAVSRTSSSCLWPRAAAACSSGLHASTQSWRNVRTAEIRQQCGPVSSLPRHKVSAGAARGWGSSSSGVRRHSSSGGVDFSSLMAGPGTALHNDIMESAARKQTG